MSNISLIIYRRRETDQENYNYAKQLSKLDKNIFLISHYDDTTIETGIFKNVNKIYYKKKSRHISNLKNFILTIIYIIKAYSSFTNFNNFIKNFKCSGIKLGDLIYDSYIRHDHKYLNPKFDFKFIKIMFFGIYRTLILENLIIKINPKQIFIGTETYINIPSICCRLGFKMNIKIIEMSKKNIKIHRHKQIYYGSDNIDTLERKKKFDNLKISENKLNIFLKKRRLNKIILGGTSNYDNKITKGIKINTSKFIEKINKLKKIKKKIILFTPHAFSDSCSQGGFFVFTDYFDQVRQTLKIIDSYKSNNNLIWIIKKHPSSNIYGEKNILKNASKSKNKKIIFCDEKVSIHEILKRSDIVITGRGTIGMEAISMGIPVVIGGKSRYSDIGIIDAPRNYLEYCNNLQNFITKLKKPSKRKMYLAKKILYFYETQTFQDLMS